MRKMGILLLSLALILAFSGMMSGVAYATGTVVNTGADGYDPSVSGSIIAFRTNEWSVGVDLNGDGDTSDNVVRYYDTSYGSLENTGKDGNDVSVSGSIIAFWTYEGSVGEDLNQDGDTNDNVVRYYDISTGTVTSTGADGERTSVSGSIIAFHTDEWRVGVDLNGDGDIGDYVIRYFMLEEAPTIEAISDQIDAFLADESIDNEGIAEASHAFIEQAQARIDKGNVKAATNVLNAFINYVNAQSGKHISTEAAQALIDSAQTVINNL